MKHWFYTATIVAVMFASTAQADFTFNDIEYWVGTGENEAAFVVDWNDGIEPQSLAWGYRWDGTATGEDMFMEIVTTDSDLYAKVSSVSGAALYGLGYDLDGDGFGLSDGTSFTDGIAVTDASDTATAVDADDHYAEGWYSAGYWGYWLSDDGTNWGFASTSMSGRTLTDGAWDGLSWAPLYDATAPSEPIAAVPEPMSMVLFGLGILAAFRRR